MTTISATGSTAATTTNSTGDVVKGAAQSLLTSLGSGSGVDTNSLVSSLVTAQYAARDAALAAKQTALTAQISGVATVKNAITTFATALSTLVKGGTLTTQPVSANSSVLGATALPGAKLAGLSSSVTVDQLAGAQIAVSGKIADRTAAIGTGVLHLDLGQATYDGATMTGFAAADGAAGLDITIDDAHSSLDGIAAAINAAAKGTVTASIVADADGGAYLSLKGATGKEQAFTLSTSSDSLQPFAVGKGATGTRIAAAAQNAKLTVDGVSVERASNSVADLVPGVKLQLSAVSKTPVALTSSTPTAALQGAVGDFVDAYNEVIGILKTQMDPVNGVLRADPAAKALLGELQAMTLSPLVSGTPAGTPTTLADLGVRTARDGTLELDSTTLVTTMAQNPQAVEAMFAYSADGKGGLSALLTQLGTEASGTKTGLGASTTTYNAQQDDLTGDLTKIADQKDQMTTRLTAQFASMASVVSAYKSTQSFLTNQIAAWNKQNN